MAWRIDESVIRTEVKRLIREVREVLADGEE
jgi:hypothetical protein